MNKNDLADKASGHTLETEEIGTDHDGLNNASGLGGTFYMDNQMGPERQEQPDYKTLIVDSLDNNHNFRDIFNVPSHG